jgi:hypothetical protein
MPFPATTVVPKAWSKHHQGVAAGGMNAQVVIGTPEGPPVYDPDTDDTTQSWTQEYSGPARVQALNDAQLQDVAGQQVAGRTYLVQLDARLPGADLVKEGMRVRVLACDNDAALVHQVLWAIDVQMGSERFTRDVVCSDNQSDATAAS